MSAESNASAAMRTGSRSSTRDRRLKTCSRTAPSSVAPVSSRSTAAYTAGGDSASSGWLSVRFKSARPQRRRTSGLDAASAWTRPSRARIDAQDFSTRGSRRRTTSGVAGSRSASTSWPAARGPNAVRALTTGPRTSLFASSGAIAPTISGSVGGARSTRRMRGRSPERRSAIAATTGSSCDAL